MKLPGLSAFNVRNAECDFIQSFEVKRLNEAITPYFLNKHFKFSLDVLMGSHITFRKLVLDT